MLVQDWRDAAAYLEGRNLQPQGGNREAVLYIIEDYLGFAIMNTFNRCCSINYYGRWYILFMFRAMFKKTITLEPKKC